MSSPQMTRMFGFFWSGIVASCMCTALRRVRRYLERLDQERDLDEQRAPLRGCPGIGFPVVSEAKEAVHRILPCEGQRGFGPQAERLVLSSNQDLRKAFNLIVGDLEGRVVCEPRRQAALQEVTPDAALEVHLIANLGLAVFLF